MTRFVSYHRVSTDKQGRSGLGLEAQQAAVQAYLDQCNGELVASFTEIMSGAVADRPELSAALTACRKNKAVLLVATIDRLGRRLSHVAVLLDSDVDVRCADDPHVDRSYLQLKAWIAERERDMISKRTIAALAAAKARGVRLGNRPGAASTAKARAAAVKKAKQRAANLWPLVASVRAAGITSLRGIAAALNARGVPAPRGGQWYAASVKRVLDLGRPPADLDLRRDAA